MLTLISLCRSVGLTFEEFDGICAHIADPESQLAQPATRVAAWTGWAGDRIRRETRDEFIRAYGGTPISVANTQSDRYTQYQQELAELEQLQRMIQIKKKVAA